MEIILIRHSTAEDKRDDLEDYNRQLTEKGIKKFKKLMPDLKEKLGKFDERNTALWSSPATRALETAHIVTNAFQLDISSIHDFIYEGNFEKFSAGIKNVNQDTTLFVVGHQPSLGIWAKEMTGKDMKIKKGSVHCFKVSNQDPIQAELQWMVNP